MLLKVINIINNEVELKIGIENINKEAIISMGTFIAKKCGWTERLSRPVIANFGEGLAKYKAIPLFLDRDKIKNQFLFIEYLNFSEDVNQEIIKFFDDNTHWVFTNAKVFELETKDIETEFEVIVYGYPRDKGMSSFLKVKRSIFTEFGFEYQKLTAVECNNDSYKCVDSDDGNEYTVLKGDNGYFDVKTYPDLTSAIVLKMGEDNENAIREFMETEKNTQIERLRESMDKKIAEVTKVAESALNDILNELEEENK